MRIKSDIQIKVGAILSYVQMGISILVTLLYTPLMINVLGKSEYGLYNTVASTISLLSILNLGFNSSYIKFYSLYKKNDELEKIKKLNGLFLVIFIIIGIIAFVCGFFITFNLDLVFKDGLSVEEYLLAKKLMIILTINLTISFPMSVFSNIISAHERFVVLKSISILKTITTPILSVPLLLLGYGSYGIVLVTLIISLLTDIIYVLYCLIKLKIRFIFKQYDKNIIKELVVFTSFIAINLLVDQINWNVDKIILGRYRGTDAVAIYSVGYTLFTFFQLFTGSMSSLFTPKVHRIVNETSGKEQKILLTDLFTKVARVQFLIAGLIITGLIFFGMNFICDYWAGSDYYESYYVMLLLCIPAIIPMTQNIGIEIQRAQNRHKFRSVAYLIMAVLNVVLSINLCKKYGPIGSAIGTAISLLIGPGLIINIYYQKRCNISIISYWNNIFRLCLGLIIPCIVGFFIYKYSDLSNIWTFIICIFVYSITYCLSMWFIAMNEYEKKLVKTPIYRLFNKNNN